MTDRIKTWLITLIVLMILLPGLPYFIMLLGLIFKPFGLRSMVLFMPALIVHNLYFSLPALLFGERLYPAEEFGYFPSATGYAVAAVLYAIIAAVLSFPISAGITKRRKQKKTATKENDSFLV